MNAIYLIFLIALLGCQTNKKTEGNNQDTIMQKNKDIEKIDKSVGILDPKEDLIVVLQNPSEITETKKIINNNGLEWDKLLLDNKSLKVGLIRVPADKKEFWLNKLIETGQFKNVKLYSEKVLKQIVKKQKKN